MANDLVYGRCIITPAGWTPREIVVGITRARLGHERALTGKPEAEIYKRLLGSVVAPAIFPSLDLAYEIGGVVFPCGERPIEIGDAPGHGLGDGIFYWQNFPKG